MKDCKGITLLALVITVIVLLIIATISINYGAEVAQKANIDSVKANMLLIEAKTKIYAEEYNFSNGTSTLIGQKVSESTENLVVQYNTSTDGRYDSYYYVSPSNLVSMGLSISKGHYLVNYDIDNIDVIYLEGINVNGIKYHTLAEIKGLE